MSAWQAVCDAQDAVGLLKMVRDVAHDQTEAKQTVMGFVESTAEFFTYHQSEKETDDEYGIMFNAMVDSIKAHGGSPWHHPGLAALQTKKIGNELARKEPDPLNIPQLRKNELLKLAKERGNKAANNEFLACQFILNSDNKRYKELKTALANRFVFGNDDYPKDTTQALALLKNFKSENKKHSTANKNNDNINNSNEENAGVAFVQPGAASGSRNYSKDQCFICGKNGHHGHDCRSVTESVRDSHLTKRKKEVADKISASKVGTQHAAVKNDDDSVASISLEADEMPSRADLLKDLGYQGMNVDTTSDDKFANVIDGIGMFNEGSGKPKSPRLKLCDWKLYLDSCATYHSVFADWCLRNVHEVEVHLKGHCNAGVTTCKEQGYYGVFKMWLNRNGIANLLSIPQLEQDGYTITYSTSSDWVVTTPQGKNITFKRDTGLCDRMLYINLREGQDGIIMLETV